MTTHVDGVNVRGFVEAVRAGDPQRVRAMLEARPELANTDLAENDERRGIHHAVLDRSVEMVPTRKSSRWRSPVPIGNRMIGAGIGSSSSR